MSAYSSPRFLRLVMLADASSVLASGLLQVVATDWLARWTGLPAWLLLWTGVFLLGYAVFAAWIGTRAPIPVALVALVAVGNALWGIACVFLIGAASFQLTFWGIAYLALNVVAVTLFAALQVTGLRRSPASSSLSAA